MQGKSVEIECIATILSGIVLGIYNSNDNIFSVNNVDETKYVLKYMLDDDVWSHAVPRLMDEVKPYLQEQYKELNDVCNNFSQWTNEKHCKHFIVSLHEKFGSHLIVYKIHHEDHVELHPMDEPILQDHMDKLITFDLTEDDDNTISPYGDINW